MEIYIGAPIEHASERDVLEAIIPLLPASRGNAIIFANLNLSGRQIDFILALSDLTLVIEAKGYTRPVRGNENGMWQVKLASGTWKDISNPYQQALSAVNALRDAMRAFTGADPKYYPQGSVVFFPAIPTGSCISPGDFKVSIIGASAIEGEISKTQTGCWTLEQWRTFARHNGLISISSRAATYDPKLFWCEQAIRHYSSEYVATYHAIASTMVDFACRSDDKEFSTEQLVRQITELRADFLLLGPSGCGKSLLAANAGVLFARRGVPITVAARDYQGNFKSLLDREVGLLAGLSAIELLSAAKQLSLPTLLIVDGYNECSETQRTGLTRSIAALSRRFEAGILITSQTALERKDLLPLSEVTVAEPDQQLKLTIATNSSSGQPLPLEIEALLASVTSGLEASLIGEVGRDLRPSTSRYGLFDAFARKRLGGKAPAGIGALSRIAGWLCDHIAQGISIRDLDRLADAEDISPALLLHLTDKKLLKVRGDRVSFSHELFFNAFAAESIVRRAEGNVRHIVTALRSPRHSDQKELILGAIDDPNLLIRALEDTSDASVIAACVSGACGRIASEWAEARFPKVLARMGQEVEHVRFTYTGDGWWNVAISSDLKEQWTSLDNSFIQCLPGLLIQHRFIVEAFSLAKLLDHRIEQEAERLRTEARPKTLRIRDSMFAIGYVISGPESPAFTLLCSGLHSKIFREAKNALIEEIRKRQKISELTSGQLYLTLALYRHISSSSLSAPNIAMLTSVVTEAITDCWHNAPYHLRLAIIDAAGYCHEADEKEKLALIDAVETLLDNKNPMLNGLVFDVLQRLRPFSKEQDEYVDTVRRQIDLLLAAPEEQESCAEAYSIYNCQFDHPYSNSYCEVIRDLADEQRNNFLKMSLKGATYTSLFLPVLISDACALNDPMIEPALIRLTEVPARDSVTPQEALEVFVTAHIALARLRCKLPVESSVVRGDVSDTLCACGTLLYWANRADLPETERRIASRHAWQTLNKHSAGTALDAVRTCAHLMLRPTENVPGGGRVENSIAHNFPTETSELCRRALERHDDQVSYFQPLFHRDKFKFLVFALDVLSAYGTGADLPLLHNYIDHSEVGKSAIKAIHTIENRQIIS